MGWRHASLAHLGADQLLRSADTVLVRGSVCVFVTMRACGLKPTTPRNSLIGVSSSCKLRRVRAPGSRARWTAAARALTEEPEHHESLVHAQIEIAQAIAPRQELFGQGAVGSCRQVPALLRAAAKQDARDREEGRGRRRRRRRQQRCYIGTPRSRPARVPRRSRRRSPSGLRKHLIRARFVWAGMTGDISALRRSRSRGSMWRRTLPVLNCGQRCFPKISGCAGRRSLRRGR